METTSSSFEVNKKLKTSDGIDSIKDSSVGGKGTSECVTPELKKSEVTTTPVMAMTRKENEMSPEDKVFSIDLILSMILRCVDSATLLSSVRLVSTRWSSEATKILQKRRSPQVCFFTYDSDAKDFVTVVMCPRRWKVNRTLEQFMLCMKEWGPGRFPCRNFSFEGGKLIHSSLQEFFTHHGEEVESLRLCLFEDDDDEYGDTTGIEGYSSLKDFAKLLTEQLPKLQVLNLDFFPFQWEYEKGTTKRCKLNLFPPKTQPTVSTLPRKPPLSNLKKLIVDSNVPHKIVIRLLEATCKLQELYCSQWTKTLVNYLIESDGLDLIKVLNFQSQSNSLQAYESMAANYTIQSFTLDFCYFFQESESWPRVAKILRSILDSGSDSLQEITWTPIGHLATASSPLVIPAFKNVRKLRIENFRRSYNCNMDSERQGTDGLDIKMFPDHLSFKSTFPNLKCLVFHNRYSIVINNIFENLTMEPAESVRELVIIGMYNFPPVVIQKFLTFFPSLKSASFKGILDFPKYSDAICKFLSLETLTLGFFGFSSGNCFPRIDAGLTGFSEETCQMLQVMSDVEIQQELDFELMRENPSLLDLKDLRSLSLEFYAVGPDEITLTKNFTPLITEVAGKYCFGLLPRHVKTKVNVIATKINKFRELVKVVESIKGYVDSCPW